MDIDKPLDRDREITPSQDQQPTITCLVGEIVRYLGEHDYVVFSDRNGGYLVNGKFHFSPSELLAIANRIRRRKKQPRFELQ
jgi:predicted RNase H-like nuclease